MVQTSRLTQTAYATVAAAGSVTVGGIVPAGKRRYVVSITVANIDITTTTIITVTDGTTTLIAFQLHATAHPAFEVTDDPDTPVLIVEAGGILTLTPINAAAAISVTFFDEP